MSYTKKSFLLAATALSLAPLGAQAQSNNQSVVLEDVVVTATRREERLQQVPIAVTAMNAAQLERANISNPKQLSAIIPNARIAQSTPEITPIIRGVANTAVNVGDDANVPTYIDGVFVAAMSQTAQDLLEVERIEVLRGPQGTLFGRNATGGLINIITKAPAHDFGGHVKVQAGSFGAAGVNAYVTGGLSETVAASLSAIYYKDDGFVKDLVFGGKANPRENYGFRGKVLWEPNDKVSFTLAASSTHWDDPTSSAFQPSNRNTVARNPAAGGNINNLIATQSNTVAANARPILNGSAEDISLKGSFDFGPVRLLTTTSAAKYAYEFIADNDASILNLSINNNHRRQKAYTQEIRLESTSEGKFKWTAGGFGYYTDAETDIKVSALNRPPYLLNLQPQVFVSSLAPFAEGSYKFTEEWNLTLGARYTWERRNFHQRQDGRELFVLSKSYGNFTPRAILQWTPSSRLNLYVSYSKGFKAGTFNTYAATATPVSPETLDSYEVGFKADPTPWFRINGALFSYNYSNLQVSARDPVTGTLSLGNAGQSKITGGELEATAKVNSDTTIRASYGIQDGEYTRFGLTNTQIPLTDANGIRVGGNRSVLLDATGKKPIRTPAVTASVSAEYGHDFGFGEIGVSGVASYSGKRYWDFANVSSSKSYTQVNAQAFWKPRENLKLAVWGNNLGDEDIVSYRSFSGAATYETFEPPRNFGVSADFSF